MNTNSVSEGSFLFMPQNFNLQKSKKNVKAHSNENKEKWNIAFHSIWNTIDREVKDVNDQLFKKVLEGLIEHIKILHNDVKFDDGILPCEIFLTGTNLPDHDLLVAALTDNIKEVTPYLSVLWSRNSSNVKNSISHLVQQITCFNVENELDSEDLETEIHEDENKDGFSSKFKLQSSQYNMSTLCAWHSTQTRKNNKCQSIVIFLPDFESFSPKVLSEFIQILSSYSSQVPIVLIFGVATTPSAVYQTLAHNVLSQLAIQVFKSDTSMSFLNQVIDKIFFSDKCPFRLGSKCMTFLTDIFLFHSFSVNGFIQGFKFCMMEHFYKKNHYSLCCSGDDLVKEIEQLSDNELENIRRIPSFQRHVEQSSKSDRALLLLNNDHTKKIIFQMMKDLQEYMRNFHIVLKCLHILTQDLPQYPLGRHLREYYCAAVSKDIRECNEYKECMRFLKFQSKDELSIKVSLIIELLKLNSLLDILSSDKNTKFDTFCSSLENYKKKFDEIEFSDDLAVNPSRDTEFEEIRKNVLVYIQTEMFDKMLQPAVTMPLNEIIFFDDLPAVRRRISGSPRGAIHLALNNPQFYLECECCTLPHSEAVLPTLPDLSVIYKLHLEFGKIINLYDWLQAFAACVKPEQTESETQADEELQARFTRAVSELQFLGFIKPSRSKSDYVNRLTWGSI